VDIRYPGYGFVPMAGNGYGFGYVMKVAGMGIQRCYPRIVYPLPSLLVFMDSTAKAKKFSPGRGRVREDAHWVVLASVA
jgi:hypothetical protein